MLDTALIMNQEGISLELAEEYNKYKDIYDILGGDEC